MFSLSIDFSVGWCLRFVAWFGGCVDSGTWCGSFVVEDCRGCRGFVLFVVLLGCVVYRLGVLGQFWWL